MANSEYNVEKRPVQSDGSTKQETVEVASISRQIYLAGSRQRELARVNRALVRMPGQTPTLGLRRY